MATRCSKPRCRCCAACGLASCQRPTLSPHSTLARASPLTAVTTGRDDRWVGVVLVVIGATMLASKGIFAKFLYARGVTPETVVAVRSVLAYPGFVAIALATGGFAGLRHVPAPLIIKAASAGFVCYYVGAGINFYALSLIDASVERALLFAYPALLVVYFWVFRGRRPGWKTLLATAATYIGIALTVGAFRPSVLEANAFGALLVLGCACTMVYYMLATAAAMTVMTSAQLNVVAMGAAAASFAVHYQVTTGWQHVTMDSSAWAWMAGLILVATVLPLYAVAEGVRRIGPQRAAIASTVGPVATTLMAFTLLGERIGGDQLLGIALIVLGILVVELRRQRPATP
ncbi:MAG: DMT family transporter [Pseudomonadota bacterium]